MTTYNVISFLSLFVFVLVIGSAWSLQNHVCPFNYEFHSGDGFFDLGNAVLIEPDLPANNWPYGMTYPGYPNGRWSDGLLDMDYGGTAFGFPTVTPSLSACASSKAVIFSVASSPVLDRSFFTERNVTLTSYAVPLSTQLEQFKTHLKSLCSTPEECSAIMTDSLFIFGDVEANDIGIPLTQGKSLNEVSTYVPYVTEASINVTRELIKMGSRRIIHPGNAPIGCFPYILTQLASNNPADYDHDGCLYKVNDLIQYKNNHLATAIDGLIKEFPDLYILYADLYGPFITVLEQSLAGPNKNKTLTACCGIGGKYNYDSERVCGTPGVPVCDDPLQYLHWDGMHLTQNAHLQLNTILKQGPSNGLNCSAPGPPPAYSSI